MHNHNCKTGKLAKFMMALCMIVPIVSMAILAFNPSFLGGNSFLIYGLFLLCPLSHLLMMKFMPKQASAPTQSQIDDGKDKPSNSCH